MLRRSFLRAFGAAAVAMAAGAHQFKRREPDPRNDRLDAAAVEQATRDLASYINHIYAGGHGSGRLVDMDHRFGVATFSAGVPVRIG